MATERYVRQLHLSQGARRLTCWVYDLPSLRVGTRVSLKGEPGWWYVEAAYPRLGASQINRNWQVGGL